MTTPRLTQALALWSCSKKGKPSSTVDYVLQARRLPKSLLTAVVRPRFQPQEYPASLTRLYQWSPDEAIPDFYTDPSVFESIHPELLDLAVPDWAASPQDFVTRHR